MFSKKSPDIPGSLKANKHAFCAIWPGNNLLHSISKKGGTCTSWTFRGVGVDFLRGAADFLNVIFNC